MFSDKNNILLEYCYLCNNLNYFEFYIFEFCMRVFVNIYFYILVFDFIKIQ